MHIPVLLEEVIEWLRLASASKFIDATLDGGGHTLEVLKRFPEIKVLGIEWDPQEFSEFNFQFPVSSFQNRLIAVNDSYVNLSEVIRQHDFQPDAILFDLGVSSWHYASSGRGFSFQKNEMLDMRFNPLAVQRTAAELINTISEEELERILAEFGEEQFSKQIARRIVRQRQEKPILTTEDLVQTVQASVPSWYRHKKIHPATKTFQALRVAVNDELGNIRAGVRRAIESLVPGGRVAVISFQGQEDKVVRSVFQECAKEGIIRWATKETIKPGWPEIRRNPRARSAKMKIAEKI